MTWIELFLIVGLSSRITRLAVYDDAGWILRRPAFWIGSKIGPYEGFHRKGHLFMIQLFGCPFCIGFWISLGVAASWAAWGEMLWWSVIAAAGTASYLAGHLGGTLDERTMSDDF